jgi:hypothetical protein
MATLYINKSESRCGACDKGADPYEESHITLTGWFAINDNMKGCGAEFDALSTDYVGFPGLEQEIQLMRPDLPYLGERAFHG